jgi:hypothetical protein
MLEKIIMKATKVFAIITLTIACIWEFGCLFGKPGVPKDEIDWVIFCILNLTIVIDYLILKLNEEYDNKIYLRREMFYLNEGN